MSHVSFRSAASVCFAGMLLGAGCATTGDADSEVSATTGVTPSHVALALMPREARRLCLSAELLRQLCPTLLPTAPWPTRFGRMSGTQLHLCRAGNRDCPRWNAFSLQWGGEAPRRPERNRPDGSRGVVHVVLYAGALGGREGSQTHSNSAFPFDWPSTTTALRDGMMRTKRDEALLLSSQAASTELVLAPPYGLGGLMGDHLILRWREGGRDYAVGLHAWEPLTEAAATLRAVVASST